MESNWLIHFNIHVPALTIFECISKCIRKNYNSFLNDVHCFILIYLIVDFINRILSHDMTNALQTEYDTVSLATHTSVIIQTHQII